MTKELLATLAICFMVSGCGKQQDKEDGNTSTACIATETNLSDTNQSGCVETAPNTTDTHNGDSEESDGQQAVRKTLTEIYAQVQQMARSSQFDTTPLTQRYCTQEFKDFYQREVQWTQENEDMLISYNCWLRLQDSESPTYSVQEIDLFEHQG